MRELIDLYKINSLSGRTSKMKSYLTSFLKKQKNVVFFVDNGNIYAEKRTTGAIHVPCVVAHYDQVQDWDWRRFDVACQEVDNDLWISGIDKYNHRPLGIGGDDKNGVWICMKMLKELDDVKVVFFRDEEIGCEGSGLAKMEFFDDCRFVIQCDRRGNRDFISNASGVDLCPDTFGEIATSYGYKVTYGMMTDVMTLKEKGLSVAACNLSCGYHNPHSDNEYTSVRDLVLCKNVVYDMCTKIDYVIPHKYERINWWDKYDGGLYDRYWYDDYRYATYYQDYTDYPKRKKSPKRGKRRLWI